MTSQHIALEQSFRTVEHSDVTDTQATVRRYWSRAHDVESWLLLFKWTAYRIVLCFHAAGRMHVKRVILSSDTTSIPVPFLDWWKAEIHTAEFCRDHWVLAKSSLTFRSLQSCKRAEVEFRRRHPQRLAHRQEEALEQHRGEAHQPGERAARLSNQTHTGREGEVRLLCTLAEFFSLWPLLNWAFLLWSQWWDGDNVVWIIVLLCRELEEYKEKQDDNQNGGDVAKISSKHVCIFMFFS